MKKILFFATLLLACTALSQKNPDHGWRMLFNGKDLSGWKQLNGNAPYDVVNGEIVGTTVLSSPNSFLATEEVFGDFVLELEFKTEGINTGVQFRSESKPEFQNGRVFGYQMEIDPTERSWTGGIYDEARRQWLYPLEYNANAKSAFRKNDWNTCRIECIGPIMRTWINGIPAAHLIDDVTPKGFIALQVHSIDKKEEEGKKVRFRNIRIKINDLKASPWDEIYVANFVPNVLTAQEKKIGVKLLWDGKTTNGWRSACEKTFPKQQWQIKDGTLQAVSSNPADHQRADIISGDRYEAFDLQFDFMLTEGADSGIKYFVNNTLKDSCKIRGAEYQIIDEEHHADAKAGREGTRTLASLYDVLASEKNPRGVKKIGEWNKGRVVVFPQGKVEHWLNGYKVLEYQREKEGDENFTLKNKGYILLQHRGDVVFFRNIKIKELK